MIFNVNNIYLFNDGKWKNLVLQFLKMQNVFQTLTKLVLWCILFVISLAYFFLNIVLLLLSVIVPLGITQARKVGQLITTSTSKILRNCERFILIVDFLTAYFIFVNMGVKLQTLILSLAISEWIIKKAVNFKTLWFYQSLLVIPAINFYFFSWLSTCMPWFWLSIFTLYLWALFCGFTVYFCLLYMLGLSWVMICPYPITIFEIDISEI